MKNVIARGIGKLGCCLDDFTSYGSIKISQNSKLRVWGMGFLDVRGIKVYGLGKVD